MYSGVKGSAYNRTREAYLATRLDMADSHWSRLRGLMATDPKEFSSGCGLWIVPCRGVHTLGMRFPIDVVYLDGDKKVLYLQAKLQPWRMAPVRLKAATVIELPSGTLDETHTEVGDSIEIEFEGNGVRK